jgi:hypothetical protein
MSVGMIVFSMEHSARIVRALFSGLLAEVSFKSGQFRACFEGILIGAFSGFLMIGARLWASDAPTFNVCICGRQSVGKTAVLHWRPTSSFLREDRPTVASAFATVMESATNPTVLLNVWDSAGQEK